MKRKIYLFNNKASIAANYGIGTYIEQVLNLVRDTNISLTVIELYSQQTKEVTITRENFGDRITIPSNSMGTYILTETSGCRYIRNVVYLLKEYIPDDEEILFHLNYMGNEYLAIELKKQFKAKILLTIHYTEWSFALLGDRVRLRKILKSPNPKESTTESDTTSIRKSIERDRKMIESCDKIICIAQHSYHDVKRIYYADECKLVLVYNGMEDSYRKFSPIRIQRLTERHHIYPYEKIILFAGRLVEVKGIHFLIKAFQRLLQSHENTRLFIVGGGNYTQLFLAAKDIWTKVTFTGYIPQKELYNLYQIADVGVVCSIHEEFGLVAIEMMMHKLPIIVTDVGGLSEIIEDGISGLKVPVQTVKGKRQVNVKCLAEKMTFLLDNPDFAKELGMNGRMRFLEKYKLPLFKEKMIKLYNSI